MTVYIVVACYPEGDCYNVAVRSSRELAEAWIAANGHRHEALYTIEQRQVDDALA